MTFFFKIFLLIYEKANNQNKKFVRLFLEILRRLFIYLGDPSYFVDIRGKRMLLPISHKLPIYILDYPLYDTLPTRISNYLRTRDGVLIMVDVGANVGDTILACSTGGLNDRFLGVEANPEFITYLKQNTKNQVGVSLVKAFCHSGNEKQVYINIQSSGGTARLLESDKGVAIVKKTLDEILSENPEFREFNFLKLDTDGNDFDILFGAQKSIQGHLPMILIECDVFENVHYTNTVITAINFLAKEGYQEVIVYDNLGNYFCTFPVNQPDKFLDAVAYQLISKFGYYDLLFLHKNDLEFIRYEKDFFLSYAGLNGVSTFA